jgi:hypothetical protein
MNSRCRSDPAVARSSYLVRGISEIPAALGVTCLTLD